MDNNWLELDVNDIAKIEKVTIQYQWDTIENPTPCTFVCLSPNQQLWFINDAEDPNGFYEKSTSIFSKSPVTGKWLFYLLNLVTGNGGAKVKNMSITFDYIPPYLESERQALVDLKYLTGHRWFNITCSHIRWNMESPCDFYGVECGQDNKVVGLNLHEFGLGGNIPECIRNLSYLKKLILSSNNLMTISPEIGQLEKLEILDLSNNPLTDLPPEIYSLTNLIQLKLSNISLAHLSSEINQLNKLVKIDLSYNHLVEIPLEIYRLTELNTLNISHNQLSAIPPEIGALSNLSQLSMSYNQLTTVPSEVGLLTKLHS